MWKEWLSDLSDAGLETLLVGLGIVAVFYFIAIQ